MHITGASKDQTDQLAALFAAAFHADPVWCAIFPRERTRARWLTRAYREQIRSGGVDSVDVAFADDSALLGALLWERPVLAPVPHRPLGVRIAAVAGGIVPAGRRALRHQRAVDAFRPREPHWYFHDIAAAPQARGRGVGTALLRHRIAAVDRQPMPVFLEATTPSSERLYARFGFVTIDHVSVLPDTGSAVMVRPATALTG
ncbi:MAG: GNAT family N-acetyltransferase [Cellulomonadaceae bacterium]